MSLIHPTLKSGPRVGHKWAVAHSPVSVAFTGTILGRRLPDGAVLEEVGRSAPVRQPVDEVPEIRFQKRKRFCDRELYLRFS